MDIYEKQKKTCFFIIGMTLVLFGFAFQSMLLICVGFLNFALSR